MSEEAPQHERRLYPSRSGERIDEYLAILTSDPEMPLNDNELERVVAFEDGLIEGRYITRSGEFVQAREERSLEVVNDESEYLPARHEITAEYFLTEEGRTLALGHGINLAGVETPQQILNAIRRVAASIDRVELKNLSKSSLDWATERITDEIKTGEVTPDFTRCMVFDDTSVLRNSVQAYAEYRTFCLRVRGDLQHQHEDEREIAAKREVADQYTKIINGKLAELYPDVLWAWDQAYAANDEVAMRDLREIWPAGETFARAKPEVRRYYIMALDRLRNGTSYDEGQPTAINQELRDLFSGESPDLHEAGRVEGGRFTPEEHEKLSKIILDAGGMKALCKDTLSELGLLSSEPEETYDENEGRTHRAADGKWQVAILKRIKSMGAEDPQGVFEIPEKFKRSLTKSTAPVGAIPGAAHEITHIYQHNNLRNNRGSLRIARKLRGRSSVVLREAGGVYSEHLIQQELFGVERPDSPHYMRAIEVIEAGGGEKQAIMAFYEGYRAANPDELVEACIEVAESRVMRLCRRYGGFNSQPLNYAQTAAFVTAAGRMSEAQRAMIFAEGAFDLPDMVALHRFGLLSGGSEQFPVTQFCDIIERKLRQMIE